MPDRYYAVREAATYPRKGEAAMRAHASATDPDRNDLDAYMDRKKDA